MGMSRRKKKPAVLAGNRSTTSKVGPESPTSSESTRGQAQNQRASKLGRLV